MAPEEIYLNHRSMLKQTSFDSDNKVYMVEDETIPVYDYDDVMGAYSS